MQFLTKYSDMMKTNLYNPQKNKFAGNNESITYSVFKKKTKQYYEKKALIFIILFSLNTNLTAQDMSRLDIPKHRIGFITGYGSQRYLNVRYKYEVVFFQFQYYRALLNQKRWGVDVVVQPQFNVSRFRKIDTVPLLTRGTEFGLNAGLRVYTNLYRDVVKIYALVSSGPHYISGAPERMAAGFTFSDNFLAGINIRLSGRCYFDFRAGFRHMSNAGLNSPNGGIHSLVMSGGILLDL